MDLGIRYHSISADTWVIRPEGSIDYSTSRAFQERTLEIFKKNVRHLLLDMGSVKYISSMGLSAIIQLMKKSRETGAELALYDSQISVKRVLEISKLNILQIKAETLDSSHPFFAYVQSEEPGRQKQRKTREEDQRKLETEKIAVAKKKK